MADEIIKELWEIKDDIADEYGCDVNALAAHLRARKHEAGRQIINLRDMNRAAEPSSAPEAKNQGL